MADKRVFDQDKVYLQDSNGTIWNFEEMLAGKEGFTPVVPNPSKKEEDTKEAKKA